MGVGNPERRRKEKENRKEFLAFKVNEERSEAPGLVAACLVMRFERFLHQRSRDPQLNLLTGQSDPRVTGKGRQEVFLLMVS